MQVSGLLTIFTALSLVVALQLGGIKNDTSTVKDNVSSTTETSVPTEDTSNSWFSIVGAIGSAAADLKHDKLSSTRCVLKGFDKLGQVWEAISK
jgi:hypothetical protein